MVFSSSYRLPCVHHAGTGSLALMLSCTEIWSFCSQISHFFFTASLVLGPSTRQNRLVILHNLYRIFCGFILCAQHPKPLSSPVQTPSASIRTWRLSGPPGFFSSSLQTARTFNHQLVPIDYLPLRLAPIKSLITRLPFS